MRKGGGARLIYEAVTRSKKAGKIRKLPPKIQERFKKKFEGIELPQDKGTGELFLEDFRRVSDKMLDYAEDDIEKLSRKNAGAVRGQLESLDFAFGIAGELLNVIANSSRPLEYMAFLARPNFRTRDILDFLFSVDIFTNGREIVFEEVPKKDRKHGAKIMELVKKKNEAHELLMLIGKDLLERSEDMEIPDGEDRTRYLVRTTFGIASLLHRDIKTRWKIRNEYRFPSGFEIDKTIFSLLERDSCTHAIVFVNWYLQPYGIYRADDGKLIPFERHFQKGALNGYLINKKGKELLKYYRALGAAMGNDMLVYRDLSKGNFIVQHELQHIFDNLIRIGRSDAEMEYRAKLSEMAFSSNPRRSYLKMRRKVKKIIRSGDMEDLSAHDEANIRIYREFDGCRTDELRKKALELLNRAYEQKFRLGYDEILEPFANLKDPAEELWKGIREEDFLKVALAVSRGADVNGRNRFGLTPLMSAAGSGNVTIVEFLIERGADVNAMDSKGRTALTFAKGNNEKDAVKFLEEHGAK